MPKNAKKLSTPVENPVENNFSESVENFIVISCQYGIIDTMPVGIHYQREETTTMTTQEFKRFFEAVAIADKTSDVWYFGAMFCGMTPKQFARMQDLLSRKHDTGVVDLVKDMNGVNWYELPNGLRIRA